jgi:Tol biopolymer transport system component
MHKNKGRLARRDARTTSLAGARADKSPEEVTARWQLGRAAMNVAKLSLSVALAFWAVAQPAQAAFPGGNGRLIWTNKAENVDWNSGDYDLEPELYTSDPNGGTRAPVAKPALAGEFSPSGRLVAFTGFPEADSEINGLSRPVLMVAASDGTGVSSLGVSGEHPAWSPHGSELVFEEARAYSFSRRLAVTNMSGAVRPVAGTRGRVSAPDWGTDGSIAFVRRERIHVVRLSGGAPRKLVNMRSASPDWSPDGKRLLFTGYRARFGPASDIWIVRGDGRGLRRVARNGVNPVWSPDGSAIAFTRRTSLWVMGADGRHQRRIVRGRFRSFPDMSWEGNAIVDPDWQSLR